MEKNPFTLMYGITSSSVITRQEEIDRIINSFTFQENMFTYLITGIRGCGKTVLLRTIEERLAKEDDWVTISVNPQRDMITSLANKLIELDTLGKELKKWSISINLGIVSVSRNNDDQTIDSEIIIEKFLNKFKELNIKLLVSIDEVNDNKNFREFINMYQMLIGKKLPVYLLMTALKENVSSLINDKAMTFLSRAPKIDLQPLSLPNIAKEYLNIFKIDFETSIEMAKLTNGYAFAFQVLGYLFFESSEKKLSNSFIDKYDKYLWENGYNKFWNDLTSYEQKFLVALSLSSHGEKAEIISHLNGEKNNYPIYRERLLEKGLIYAPRYGALGFVLPRFKEYIKFAKEFM